MANAEFTTNPRVSSVEFLHALGRAGADVKTDGDGDGDGDGEEERDLLGVLEEALEEERSRLMLANSMLGCVQVALDPEAVAVVPGVYFPEVLELARQFIDKRVQKLEYEEIRRVLHRTVGGAG
jgi:hypothetical protein